MRVVRIVVRRPRVEAEGFQSRHVGISQWQKMKTSKLECSTGAGGSAACVNSKRIDVTVCSITPSPFSVKHPYGGCHVRKKVVYMRLIQHAQAMNGLGTKNHHDLDPVNLLYCTAQRPTHESNHALRPISSAYGSLFKSPTAT
jgi:hypothetical protein